MLSRPDRVPRNGRARRPMTPGRRLAAVRWVIVAVWAALLIARIIVVARSPEADLTPFGIAEIAVIVFGVGVILAGVLRMQGLRRRREDESLALAIRRIDPTVWLVPAAPTAELRAMVEGDRSEITLGSRVTWAFGATEASLWELDERRATRLLVIRWSRVMHVGLEDVPAPGDRGACAVAMHFVRPDDTIAVATFHVRTAPGSRRLLGRGPKLERLLAELARERIVA
ncbi:hypothetical protein AAEP80_07460 [Curtobacterium sp. L3-7]|uniref:hypothetical protein n=1 Tax=Curtobacterium sp. L3-7 TaxID=3138787 RepID=UPI003B5174B2